MMRLAHPPLWIADQVRNDVVPACVLATQRRERLIAASPRSALQSSSRKRPAYAGITDMGLSWMFMDGLPRPVDTALKPV